MGKQMADLHLLNSSALDSPIAKYQGKGENDRIEKNISKASRPKFGIIILADIKCCKNI